MGVVYMLAFENLHYIGSTTETLNRRISKHKDNYNSWLNKKTKSYCSSFEIIKNKDYEVIVIEEIKKEKSEECREREQNWIEFYGINNLINNRNSNTENLEKRRKSQKKYYNKLLNINSKN